MKDVLLAPANLPFAVALAVVVGLALLEIISMALGFALSHAVDSALHVDMDHGVDLDHGADLDHDVDVDGPGLGFQVLNFLHVGAVPVMILLTIFLFGFGASGLVLQEAFGRNLNVWLASAAAIGVGLAGTRVLGGFARKHVFREDSSAVSQDSFIGLTATITLGATRKGTPSQAKLQDKFGQSHYILVEPLRDEDTFEAGETIMLVQRDGHKYYAIENSAETLFSLGPDDLSAENRLKA